MVSKTPEKSLPARYEIRQLGPEHTDWAAAIVCHSNAFHSTVFPAIYPDGKAARFHRAMKAAGYLVAHQIQSGLSYGVFDKEFRFRQPQSALTGGKLYWDADADADVETMSRDGEDVTGADLLAAMDFPLVSVALAYDGVDKLDFAQLIPLVESLPVFGLVYQKLDELDPRAPASWREPTERKTLLMRNATSTRHEYEGRGLMGALARHLMRTAAGQGFKTCNIECLNDAVTHVWAHPPAPFRGEIVAQFRTEEYRARKGEGEGEGEGEGKEEVVGEVNPFYPARQLVTRVCTTFSE